MFQNLKLFGHSCHDTKTKNTCTGIAWGTCMLWLCSAQVYKYYFHIFGGNLLDFRLYN